MMENQLPLTSPDGSRNGNTPERCPRPLDSQDSIDEQHKVLLYHQSKNLKHIKIEVKEEAEELYVRSHKPCKEEDIPLEISADSRGTRRDFKAEEEEEGHVRIKEEENPIQITDLGDTRGTQRDVKPEKEEKQIKTKRKILEIGMDGRYRWYNMEKHPTKPPDGEIVEDDITAYVAEERAGAPHPQPLSCRSEKPFLCPDCGKGFTHQSYLIIHHRSHTGEKPFVCPECHKRFSYKCSLAQHLAAHTAVWAFPCPDCGKRFRTGWILAAHRRLHSNEDIQR